MIAGGCHCGAVRYEAPDQPNRHSLCGCRDCAHNAGAPYVAWAIYGRDDVKITKGTVKMRASSDHGRRYFCADCGTGLFYTSDAYLPGLIDIQSATLDDPNAVNPPTAIVQTAERIGWAAHIHELPTFPRYPGQ